MKKVCQWFILSFLVFYGATIWAADAVEQLKIFSASAKSSAGDFVQQQVSIGSDGQPKVLKELSGHFMFLRPGKFVWEVSKPYQQKLVGDGKQIAMWDKDLNQVTYRKATQALASTPAAILFGDTAIEQFFDITPAGKKGELTWLELTPKLNKSGGGDIPYRKIGVGMMNNLPYAMELRDNFGNVVLLTLSHLRTNLTISASEFVFKPPPGTDVVKLP